MGDAAEERDGLTRARLADAGAHLRGMEVLGFTNDWWDGQTHAPCLVIRGGRGSRRQRIVETGGEAVIVPFARRSAERWLAKRRQPRRAELVEPDHDRGSDVVVEVEADVVRCRSYRCGALLLVGYEGVCPICGG